MTTERTTSLVLGGLVVVCAGLLVGAWDHDVLHLAESRLGSGLLLAGMVMALIGLLAAPGADTPMPAVLEGEEAWVCKHCLRPNVPRVDFCPHCGCPQTFFACTGPYERIYASAWCLGKAVRFPSRRLHVVGLTLVLGTGVLESAAYVVLGLTGEFRNAGLVAAAHGIFLLALLCIYGYMLVAGFWNFCVARHREGAPQASTYGAPPSWTFDAHWVLPEGEDEARP